MLENTQQINELVEVGENKNQYEQAFDNIFENPINKLDKLICLAKKLKNI